MTQGFHSTFYSFGGDSFEPSAWQSHFLDYDPDAWDEEGDGVLQFNTDGGRRYSLIVFHNRRKESVETSNNFMQGALKSVCSAATLAS